MTTLASVVIGKARIDLQDTSGVRWVDADMLGYLNDGQVMVAVLKPPASIVTGEVALVAGCRQALPAAGVSPVRFGKNVTGGTVPNKTSPEALDVVIPDWQSHAAAAKVTFVAYSPAEPKAFLVYPAQPVSTTQKLEITYYAVPAAIAAAGNNITLADEYVPALIDYLLYRAFAKDAEVPDAVARSQAALGNFASKLGIPAAAVRKATQQQAQG